MALGLVAFVLVAGEPASFVRTYFPVLFGVVMAVLFSVIAAWVHVSRFYINGALICLAGAVHQWGGVDLWVTVTSAGSVIILSGIVVLVRFLRNNPRLGEGQK